MHRYVQGSTQSVINVVVHIVLIRAELGVA